MTEIKDDGLTTKAMFPGINELKADGWTEMGYLDEASTTAAKFLGADWNWGSMSVSLHTGDPKPAQDTDEVKSMTWTHTIDDGPVYTLGALQEMKQAEWDEKKVSWSSVSNEMLYGYASGAPYSHYNEQRVPKDHECPHCFRQRHPEALTQLQAQMYDSHEFDASYDAAADESGVVCIGADYEGPVRHAAGYLSSGWYQPQYTESFGPNPAEKLKNQLQNMEKLWQTLMFDVEPVTMTAYTWLAGDPYLPVGEPEKLPTEPDKLPIKFNDPDNWKPWEKPWYPVDPGLDIKWEDWHTNFPTPDSPAYDFSAFSEPEVKYPKRKKKK